MTAPCSSTQTDQNAYDVLITYVDSPSKFFVVSKESAPLLDSLREEIEIELAKKAVISPIDDILLSPSERTPLAPCIASWQGCWYRARIMLARGDGKLEIEYIDYGNTGVVDLSETRKWPANPLISDTQRLSWPCRLYGDLSRMDKRRFQELYVAAGGRFRMKIDAVDDQTGQYIVTLYTDGEHLRNEPSINEMISGEAAKREMVVEATPAPAQSYIGPIGGRLGKRSKATAHLVAPMTQKTTDQAKQTESVFSLNAISEELPKTSVVTTNNVITQKSKFPGIECRFASDIEAVLDGPLEESATEEEDEQATASKSSASKSDHSQPVVRDGSGCEAVCTGSDSHPSMSTARAKESLRSSRAAWSRLLSLRYGILKAPAPGNMSAEQQVTITRIISPVAFYAQTTQQTDSLRCLELSMADELRPNQPPIPADMLVPGVCCAVYSGVSKTWRRGEVVTVHAAAKKPDLAAAKSAEANVDVRLVDTGYERCFVAGDLKPIGQHFTYYLPLVFFVKLSHPFFDTIAWKQEDGQVFRRMVQNRTLTMKFVSDDSPQPEVELLDMSHSCDVCSGRLKKCTINQRLLRWIEKDGGFASRTFV